MDNRISANYRAINKDKWGHDFLEFCLNELSRRKGVSRQYLISRLIVSGLACDKDFSREFEVLKQSWLSSREGSDVSQVKSFVADILGNF